MHDSRQETLDRVSALDKSIPGRGRAIIVYGLYLGAIMLPLTLPVGAVIAYAGLRRSPEWVASHLRFQVATFAAVVALAFLAVALWALSGVFLDTPMAAWVSGYLAATLGLAWFVGRCAVGIYRITANRPIPRPRSLLFGS